jgi:hypothetical protein
VRKDLDSPLGLVRIDESLLPARVLPNPLGLAPSPRREVWTGGPLAEERRC